MTESIDVEKITEKIRNQVKENFSKGPINEKNISSIASQKFKNRKNEIIKSNSKDAKELQHLDSITLKASRFQNNSDDESLPKELEQANLSYDIQTFNKIDTSKPKIIRNLVLKLRNIFQNEVRFALNPIVDNQIKFNIHSVRSITGIKKLLDKIEQKHHITSDLVKGQSSRLENLASELAFAQIFRAYNQYLKRDPNDEEITFWRQDLASGKMNSITMIEAIKKSDEAWRIRKAELESLGISIVDKAIAYKKVDDHIIHFNVNDYTYLEPFSKNELYESEETNALKKLLKKGMNVINVGANIGYYALLAARQVGPESKVFAFEPFPQSVAVLKKNIESNNYHNVEVIEMAVSNKSGKANLSLKADTAHHFISSEVNSDFKQIQVFTTTIDDFLVDKNLKIDFIIMDAEGYENYILEGMKKTIKKNPEIQIITEYNPYTLELAGTTGKNFLDKIEELGFSIQVIDQDKKKSQKQIKDEILKIRYPNVTTLYLKMDHNNF